MRVVSTIWTEDEASKELMTVFYNGMLHDALDPP
jgi:CHAT domain-containing protein